ncbi:hypothetical protein N7532_000030 [Penicillium argentinense]|uniref:Uncharacterized protein n=1 Tax=Penicillium argentinense TaxID=1131581 RepID=A0A9W9G4G7_9EURO|nr:uncharacterized protein N7532_000030 [Penicillium argentinense]KAJ5111985.1 hypothetical protein N7532_000030 [Penicillium argentinense]
MSSTERSSARLRKKNGSRQQPSLLIRPDEGVPEVIELEDTDGLIEWIRVDSETAWRVIMRRQDRINEFETEPVEIRDTDTDADGAMNTNQAIMELAEKNARLENEIAQLREQTSTAAIAENYAEEYAQIREERDAAIHERDGVLTTMRLIGKTPVRESPVPSTISNKKSTKMPDPPMLNDGKDVKFKTWRNDIRRKLLLNEDHYPTAAHQLAYINVFDHLEGVFHDPNQKQAARDEYLTLKMEPKKQDFTDFLAEFTYLAEEAEQPEELRKEDLYRKFPVSLQNQVMAEAGDNDVSFEKFVRKCQIITRLVNQQFASRTANVNAGGNRGRTAPNTSTKGTSSVNKNTGTWKQMDEECAPKASKVLQLQGIRSSFS